MICENCNENEANIKYTQIINGVKKQMNLCDKCARNLGIDNISFNMPLNFSNFLGDMLEDNESIIPTFINPKKLECDKCNSSYNDFINTGKFGCDQCYETFETKIDTLLKNIQGTNKHIGRIGKQIENANKIKNDNLKTNNIKQQNEKQTRKSNNKETKLEELKERLKKEIKEERYEDAAITRDEIKNLET